MKIDATWHLKNNIACGAKISLCPRNNTARGYSAGARLSAEGTCDCSVSIPKAKERLMVQGGLLIALRRMHGASGLRSVFQQIDCRRLE
eukprot:9141959-Pyramimonas_sp.AAC.1